MTVTNNDSTTTDNDGEDGKKNKKTTNDKEIDVPVMNGSRSSLVSRADQLQREQQQQ